MRGRQRCAQHQEGAQQNQGRDAHTTLGDMPLQEACRASGGQGMCKPVEDQTDLRGCQSKEGGRGAGRQGRDVQT